MGTEQGHINGGSFISSYDREEYRYISSYDCFLREMLREMVDQMSIHQEVGGPDINIPPFQRFVPDPPSRMYSRMFRYKTQLVFWIWFQTWIRSFYVKTSVADPDPPDPHVFGPPGSGSTSQRYGSGFCSGFESGSFYNHAKIVRKTLIPTIL